MESRRQTPQSNIVTKPQVRDGVTDGEGAIGREGAVMRVGGCVFVYDVCARVCVRLRG